MMRNDVQRIALATKGFLDDAEGRRLYELARASAGDGPCLEIGSYCGKSSLYLGAGCQEAGAYPLFTVDHHRGSAEQQPGEAYFDAELYDAAEEAMTTLPHLVRTIREAGLDHWIIPIVAESTVLGRFWPDETLSLLFVDGSHVEDEVRADYRTWARCVRRGGYLCFHDVYADPEDGGQAPYHVVCEARATGWWEDLGTVGSLAILRRR